MTGMLEIDIITLIVLLIVRKVVMRMKERVKKMSERKDIFEQQMPQVPTIPRIPTMVVRGNARDMGENEVATIMPTQVWKL